MFSAVLILPLEEVKTGNAVSEAMGWGTDSYSVPLSLDAKPPASHMGLHTWATDEFKWMVDTGYYPRILMGVVDKDAYQKMMSSLLSSFEGESEGHFSRCLEELRLAVVTPDEKEPV